MANYPPQRDTESAQAYQAACAYFEMGADRSQEAVSEKLAKSRQLMSRWSAQHAWADRSREYDQALAQEAAAQHTTRYLADLEAHRKKASDAGQALYTVAGQLIKQLNHALNQPRYIEGKDGKRYQLHGVDLTAGTFAIAARAMQTALDLEAHALGVDTMLGKLADDSE
jgi:hypothetical protein